MTLDELNALSPGEAADALRACCGSTRWVETMVAHRPFVSFDHATKEAGRIWWALDRNDWLEAFAHHPRIGERTAAAKQDARARSWSSGEQRGAEAMNEGVASRLAAANAEYERRFGYIYIVCASGKSAEEMLALATTRLTNDPETEIGVAAGEQHRITMLRLEKLLQETAP